MSDELLGWLGIGAAIGCALGVVVWFILDWMGIY